MYYVFRIRCLAQVKGNSYSNCKSLSVFLLPSPGHVGVPVLTTEPSPQLVMAGPVSLTALQPSGRHTDDVDLEQVLGSFCSGFELNPNPPCIAC